jgi:hypothetical protein
MKPTTLTVSLDSILERETSRPDEPRRGGVCRGVVSSLDADAVHVDLVPAAGRSVPCDVLDGGVPLQLAAGDPVIVLLPDDREPRGCILGRVRRASDGKIDAPDSIHLQAKRDLTLRVGEGSITLRADGRILVKGESITSTARKLIRIRGGAVSLN